MYDPVARKQQPVAVKALGFLRERLKLNPSKSGFMKQNSSRQFQVLIETSEGVQLVSAARISPALDELAFVPLGDEVRATTIAVSLIYLLIGDKTSDRIFLGRFRVRAWIRECFFQSCKYTSLCCRYQGKYTPICCQC